MTKSIQDDISRSVAAALAEDLGNGDLTAALLDEGAAIEATVVTREAMVMAGRPWFEEVMRQVDHRIIVQWQCKDGDTIAVNAELCRVRGPARSVLTAERTALNFLQLLSATATETDRYVRAVEGTGCQILDTRKTIPGLRLAQKYAVRCGGGVNHRVGLFDAILIKENHIASAGGIAAAIAAARDIHPGMPVEVEVEDLDEVREALAATAERLMLDNFTLDTLQEAVNLNLRAGNPPAKLEASGNITLENVQEVARTGVDYISIGALTKHVQAVDLSMRFSD